MPVNIADNEILLRCACGNLQHIAYLIHDPNRHHKRADRHFQGERFKWYFTTTLNAPGILERVRQAVRYILVPHTLRFGNYVELALRSEDVDRLAEFIEARIPQTAVVGADGDTKAISRPQ
jgi:hypothetical protein